MKLELLRRTHPDFAPGVLQLHADLFAGGAQFRQHIGTYLPQHDVEPGAVWERRKRLAHYVNYTAPIVNLFASLVASDSLSLDDAGDWWSAWDKNVDGLGTDLEVFAKRRLVDALVAQRSWWRVELPTPDTTPDSRAQFDALGLGDARLVAVPTRNIVHWCREEDGSYRWVVEYDRREELEDWLDAAPTLTETWTLWHADGSTRRWQLRYAKGSNAPAEAAEVEAPYNPLGTSPLVCLEMPSELYLLNLLADGQLELFRKRCALSWAIDRTCYAMPVLKTASKKKPDLMGAGYYLQLGKDDSLEWPAPPSSPFDTISAYIATLKDEVYRVAQQMASGVDNNAAAVGRSGESKKADAEATTTVACALGKLVREALQKTAALIASARNEEPPKVCGYDEYKEDDLAELVDTAVNAKLLEIPSATFRKILQQRIAKASLEDLDEETKQKIDDEIAAANEPAPVVDESTNDAADAAGEGDSNAPPHAAASSTNEPPTFFAWHVETGCVTREEIRRSLGLSGKAPGIPAELSQDPSSTTSP